MTREAQELVERLANEAASRLGGFGHFKANAKSIAEVLAPVAELIEAIENTNLADIDGPICEALNRLRDAAGHSK